MEAIATTETTTNLRRWENDTYLYLINSFFEYKRFKMYKKLDFDTDKSMRCEKAQIRMDLLRPYQKILKT